MNKAPKPIEFIDGIPHEVTLFMGDGKLYDERRQECDPIRSGSRLLRPLVVIENVETGQTSVVEDFQDAANLG